MHVSVSEGVWVCVCEWVCVLLCVCACIVLRTLFVNVRRDSQLLLLHTLLNFIALRNAKPTCWQLKHLQSLSRCNWAVAQIALNQAEVAGYWWPQNCTHWALNLINYILLPLKVCNLHSFKKVTPNLTCFSHNLNSFITSFRWCTSTSLWFASQMTGFTIFISIPSFCKMVTPNLTFFSHSLTNLITTFKWCTSTCLWFVS